jgi:DNA (cytosine-5)-methyltransferase 1
VQSDLEALGYQVQPVILPAVSVNAPHRRDRVWFVAYSNDIRSCEQDKSKKQQGRTKVRGAGSDDGGIVAYNNDRDGSKNRLQTRREINVDGTQRTGPTPNTCSQGLQGSADNRGIRGSGKKRDEQSARCLPPTWENFPAQSPICSGDDGISDRLDGITFPKWRNESIKAYGNAIVPQVAFEIFKVIGQLEC